MKKFFVVLCGIFIVGNAFGASRSPEINDDYLIDWKVGQPYDKDVSDTFTKPEYLHNREGTYGDGEGAIVAFVAREIYRNGAKFCATQIQAANENWNDHSWIDYYDNDFPCQPVCKSGYTGEKCDEIWSPSEPNCVLSDFTKTTFAKSILDKIKTSGKSQGLITETDMQVFYHEPGYGLGENRNAWDTVLGVVEIKQHGLVVVPIRIQGRRTGMWPAYRSYIVNVHSNDQPTLLCANGYVESNGDCIKSPQCENVEKLAQMCHGYAKDDYVSAEHELKTGTGGCTYFRCMDHKGFKSDSDKTCVECPGGALAYINSTTGVCKQCKTGEVVNDTKDDCSSNVKSYSKSEMKKNGNRECWLETDPRKFAGCVIENCPNDRPCYDSSSKNCKECN